MNKQEFYLIKDVIVMVLYYDEEVEYYIKDIDNNFPFMYMFSLKEFASVEHLEFLYKTGFYDSYLDR